MQDSSHKVAQESGPLVDVEPSLSPEPFCPAPDVRRQMSLRVTEPFALSYTVEAGSCLTCVNQECTRGRAAHRFLCVDKTFHSLPGAERCSLLNMTTHERTGTRSYMTMHERKELDNT